MSTSRTTRFAAALAVAMAGASASAATLTSAYEFNGDFHDAILEGHDNDLLSGTRGVGAGTLTASTFQFGANQGVSLGNALASTTVYSIELYFRFGTANKDANYRAVFDPGLMREDEAFYYRGNEALRFYPGPDSAGNVAPEGQYNHIVLTRSTDGTFRAYANGSLVLTDSTSSTQGHSVAEGNVLHFFEDDAGEAAPGEIDYLRFYDGALDAREVSRLYGLRDQALHPVPLPASLALLAPALAALRLRRRG